MSSVSIEKMMQVEDVKPLRFASEKKFAAIWKEEKDNVWESYL